MSSAPQCWHVQCLNGFRGFDVELVAPDRQSAINQAMRIARATHPTVDRRGWVVGAVLRRTEVEHKANQIVDEALARAAHDARSGNRAR